MKLLLDTHVFLWFINADKRLSAPARRAMQHEDAELLLSAVSILEMAIKSRLGRLSLPAPLNEFIPQKMAEGYRILPLEWPHAAAVEHMPLHHRDPFDRLLVAQSTLEDIPLVSGDSEFSAYKLKVIW